MSAHTKKLHTEIRIDKKKYYIPTSKKKPFLILLQELGAEKEPELVHADDALKSIYKNRPKGSAHLRGARTKEGLSQGDLSKKTGIPIYNISKMENGSRPIGEQIAKKLAKALRINYKVLLLK